METKIYDVTELNRENLTASMEQGDDAATARVEAALSLVDEAAEVLQNGGLVAFPTETVYGLGANALDPVAVKKVYTAKGRPSDNPMIVHIARASELSQLTPKMSVEIIKLIDAFWPGPLTLVLPKQKEVPDEVTGGLSTVGIRMPDDPVALELIRKAGVPVAAPSANLSGSPSPTRPEHVIADLDGKIDVILRGGNCRIGIESTVLDLSTDVPTILRPGMIAPEDIQGVLRKKVEIDPALLRNEAWEDIHPKETADGKRTLEFSTVEGKYSMNIIQAPKAPGMKYTHYAPKASMTIFEGSRDNVKKEIQRVKEMNESLGNKVGVILFEENDFVAAAQDFFARLRALDEEGADLILAGALSTNEAAGFAVMNRMMKAAGYHIVSV